MTTRKKDPGLWTEQVGSRPCTVTVFERRSGGPTSLRWWEGDRVRWQALGHSDRERALAEAHEMAAKLRRGELAIADGETILAQLMLAYEKHRTPRKSATEQEADARRIEMWTRVLGADQVVTNITLEQWERFIDERKSGTIDAYGRRVEVETDRRPVRDRTVEADLTWLRLVVGWGAKWRDRRGEYLLPENVLRGYPIPREKNPRRPVATTDRYEAIMELLSKVERGQGPKSKTGRRLSFGYLDEILPIVGGTARRLSAVLALRYSDLLPTRGDHGSIRWRGDHDKGGRESVTYIGPDVRAAINKALARRPGIGEGWLFAAPRKPSVHVSRSVADKWLRLAEKAVGLETQKGSLWHAYKRARVSAWIDAGFPLTAIGKATGNRDERNLLRAYGHAVDSTVQTMVNTRIEIREANQ